MRSKPLAAWLYVFITNTALLLILPNSILAKITHFIMQDKFTKVHKSRLKRKTWHLKNLFIFLLTYLPINSSNVVVCRQRLLRKSIGGKWKQPKLSAVQQGFPSLSLVLFPHTLLTLAYHILHFPCVRIIF